MLAFSNAKASCPKLAFVCVTSVWTSAGSETLQRIPIARSGYHLSFGAYFLFIEIGERRNRFWEFLCRGQAHARSRSGSESNFVTECGCLTLPSLDKLLAYMAEAAARLMSGNKPGADPELLHANA
jgi:hypothetical protein